METTAQVHARLSALPRAALGFFPTPFHRAENLSRELGVDLWLKRDDLTGMSLFGGNKVRKLEYVLGEARARGCDTVVSYGATQSNCAMQVATACRRLGMRPILYLVAIVEPAELRANLLLDYVLDAEVHLVPLNGGTEEEAEEEARFVLDKIRGYALTGPVVFDWEALGKSEARTYGLDTDTLCRCALAFCELVEEAGYTPMIYLTSYAGYVKYDLSRVMDYPFWFAEYDKAAPTFYYHFQMWQYTSKGSVNGIQGNVDMNLWFGA